MKAEPNPDLRVRFAPSPTGFLHVGSARTALFNWLYARATGGKFVLRIEDTDESRNQSDVIDVIFRELEWLGLDWDEEPVFQSSKRERHREVVAAMLANGQAYLVDDDKNEVAGTELVDGHAVRFRVPAGQDISFDDDVRGSVSFSSDDLEDFVIWRSNGTAMFLLANAVDDADMGITHAIRGEDILNTAPKVKLLLDAMGAKHPRYGHLSLLVGEDRKKLSKRRDSVAIADFRSQGFVAPAMTNYLALLGWGPPDDVEIRPMSEIVELFNITDVSKAPAFFDLKKLTHFNHTYIQALTPADFVEQSMPWMEADTVAWEAAAFDRDLFLEVAPEIQQRAKLLEDTPALMEWMYVDEVTFNDKAWQKGIVKGKRADDVLAGVLERYRECSWDAETLGSIVKAVGDELEVRSQVPVRVAVTGTNAGIPLFEPLVTLGRERTVARLERARARIAQAEDERDQ